MNIFILDRDPIVAARMHCDKHIPKMTVEVYQQIASAARRHGATDGVMPLNQSGMPVKGGYHHHPCTEWVGDSRANYKWACVHGIALACEFAKRFQNPHHCFAGITTLWSLNELVPEGDLTPFAQAMPDQYRHDDAVTAYRDYYWCEKRRFAKWEKGTPVPEWWEDAEKEGSEGAFHQELRRVS